MSRSVVAWCMPRIYPKAMRGRMIDFSDELWEAVRVDAEARGTSRGAFVRQAVSDALRPIGGLVTDSDDPAEAHMSWDCAKRGHLVAGGRSTCVLCKEEAIRTAVELLSPDEEGDPRASEPISQSKPSGPPCPHPKASRRQLSYGTFCDTCQDMVR